MSEKEKPRWRVNKDRYNSAYNKEHAKTISIKVYDSDIKYYRYWLSIPNKSQWLKDRLDEYAKENGLD